MTAAPPMRPWDYVKAIGLNVMMTAWCAAWLIYDAFIVPLHGWERVLFPVVFALLLGWNVRLLPRSLRSYQRMRASAHALGLQRAKLVLTLVKRGYPPEVVLRVDHMIMAEAPLDDVLAVMAEHRPPRHFRG